MPDDIETILRDLARLLQPGRDAGMPGLVQPAAQVLGMDMLIVAERDASAGKLETLARVGSMSNERDVLAEAFVQRALAGDAVIGIGAPLPPDMVAYARATHSVRCAALPLFDAHREVLGVMVCASRHEDAPDAAILQPLLEIVAARFAALLELRAERGRGRDRALLDGLTDLPNRLLFLDRLESALHDARRTGEVLAVLFVDLDRFKGINDSLGHAVGDQVLVAVAERLRNLVRASDTIARYAGDEFTLILRHVNGRADAARVAAKLLAGMRTPLALDDGSELQVTTSIGVSVYPDDATNAEGLVKHADMAMYSAKGEGRNKVKAFGAVPEETHRQHLEMEARLRKAEANGELSVHYQPQIELASGDVVAVEALVRWRHPALGMLSPAFFVPLAEETGLIISIGEWVLRRACIDVAEWRRRTGRPLRLAVNLSALQWMQPNLVAMIRAACRDAGLQPGVLDLETPEGVLADPQAELVASVRALRRIGCRIVVDDAGVAPAAPGRAPRLAVDAVKIDHSFIRNLGSDPDDEAVVTAILDHARRRRVRTIAEGVETGRQLDFLRAHGCDAAQGYLFCRPLPAAALTDWLAAQRAAPAADKSRQAGKPR
ncbi:MAG: diguanylate cyclase/phosphodiesterase (GGDEF & EAL domains) with PAS/PAC sensor(s) [Rhodanobacteraceae bacterium]|jgi:diguanylate cyclase (GGDEF)-like protein|nr:MAG: diguanylate cyclase/phosphodiesterase (GGDEF & EAL domains) with PAS/PAC sensor(s) [Rhodanobacteraceae bacterium]